MLFCSSNSRAGFFQSSFWRMVLGCVMLPYAGCSKCLWHMLVLHFLLSLWRRCPLLTIVIGPHVSMTCCSAVLFLMQVSLGPASGGGANPAQLRNIALCSQLQEVHRSMHSLLPRLPTPAAAALQGPLDSLAGCAVDSGELCCGIA